MDLNEIDRLAAEKVMGYINHGFHYSTTAERKTSAINHFNWQPTRDISQAWMLLDRLSTFNGRETYYKFQVNYELKEYYCRLKDVSFHDNIHAGNYFSREKTAPLAITKACLRAIGIEI